MAWNVAFAGTPAFAATVLERLLDSPHRVGLVYTQPDRPAGRGRKLTPSPVRRLAAAADIEVRTPTRLPAEAPRLREFDCLLVAAYGLLLPPPVLAAPSLGCLNVHASLLPRWRGAAPIERAIMAGDAETGVSIMQIAARLDAGPVYLRRRLPLSADATAGSVSVPLAKLGADALLDVLHTLPDIVPQPQDDRAATYAPKLTADDSRIDWQQAAVAIHRQVRALGGRQAAYTTAGDARLRILAAQPSAADIDGEPGTLRRAAGGWHVACGEGALAIRCVQLNRGKGVVQPMQSAANGYPRLLFDGTRFAVSTA